MHRWSVLAAAALLGLVVTGCGDSSQGRPQSHDFSPAAGAWKPEPLPWDRPADQQRQVRAAGLSLTGKEQLQVHYHAHLDVFVDGKAVSVPPGLGINAGLDGKLPPHGSPGIAPLHTHEPDGVLHVEAAKDDTFTLGQVFTEWGVLLTPKQVGAYRPVQVYVNGKRFSQNPADLVLKAHQEVAVVAGKADVEVPDSYDFPPGE